MIYDRHDVVLVLFPFTEKEGRKQRPAIVLTDRAFNQAHGLATLLMVTTGSVTQWQSDLPIKAFKEAGLRNHCFVRAKFFTAPTELLIARIGSLSDSDARCLGDWLQDLLIGAN